MEARGMSEPEATLPGAADVPPRSGPPTLADQVAAIDAVAVAVPQTREAATEMLADYGEALRQIEAIETVMNGDLAKRKQQAVEEAAPFTARADALFKGLQAYCDANRAALTENGKTKTVDFGTGTVSWRWNPAKVNLRGKVEDIITRIRNAGDEFQQFLRQTVEVDRAEMLRNP